MPKVSPPSDFSPELLAVARSLGLDQVAGMAVERLRAAGVSSILLKGPGIATWLYDEGEVRPYLDVDLLVSPRQLEQAKSTLAGLGYVDRLAGADQTEFGLKEQDLVGPGNVCIDLHHGLIGVPVPGQQAWNVLVTHTVPFRLGGGGRVEILDVAARTMHLALHAAQNGPIDRKALADLERGVSRLDLDDWRQASILAHELGADEAFAAGLRLVPAGGIIADQLSLTRQMSVELALRTRSAPLHAIFFERMAEVPGIGRKAALIARKLFPTTAYLRADSAQVGRGHLGLLRAWMSHLANVAAQFGPSLVAWYRARGDAGR